MEQTRHEETQVNGNQIAKPECLTCEFIRHMSNSSPENTVCTQSPNRILGIIS